MRCPQFLVESWELDATVKGYQKGYQKVTPCHREALGWDLVGK